MTTSSSQVGRSSPREGLVDERQATAASSASPQVRRDVLLTPPSNTRRRRHKAGQSDRSRLSSGTTPGSQAGRFSLSPLTHDDFFSPSANSEVERRSGATSSALPADFSPSLHTNPFQSTSTVSEQAEVYTHIGAAHDFSSTHHGINDLASKDFSVQSDKTSGANGLTPSDSLLSIIGVRHSRHFAQDLTPSTASPHKQHILNHILLPSRFHTPVRQTGHSQSLLSPSPSRRGASPQGRHMQQNTRRSSFDVGGDLVDDARSSLDARSYMPSSPVPLLRDHHDAEAAHRFEDAEPVADLQASTAKSQPQLSSLDSQARCPRWIGGMQGLAALLIFTSQSVLTMHLLLHHEADFDAYDGTVTAFGTPSFILRNEAFAVALLHFLAGRKMSHTLATYNLSAKTVTHRSRFEFLQSARDHRIHPQNHTHSHHNHLLLLMRKCGKVLGLTILIHLIQSIIPALEAMDHLLSDTIQIVPHRFWKPPWAVRMSFMNRVSLILRELTVSSRSSDFAGADMMYIVPEMVAGYCFITFLSLVTAEASVLLEYGLLAVLAIAYAYTCDVKFLYTLAHICSKLRVRGTTPRLQQKWFLVSVIEIIAASLALLFLAATASVSLPLDTALQKILIKGEAPGYDALTTWPRTMLPSSWLPLLFTVVWVELSFAGQFFFKLVGYLGHISLASVLLANCTIFTIVPLVAQKYDRLKSSYWSIIGPAYCVTLFINALLAMILAFLLYMLNEGLMRSSFGAATKTNPPRYRHMPNKFISASLNIPRSAFQRSRTYLSTRYLKILDFLRSCSSPTQVNLDPGVTEEVSAKLHSTLWSDNSPLDSQSQRTIRLLNLQRWAFLVHIPLIPATTFCWWWFHPTGKWTWDLLTFTTVWRFVWILSLPTCLLAYIGLCLPERILSKRDQDQQKVFRRHIGTLYILIVTKGFNEKSLRRSYARLSLLERCHPAVKVYVLTDEPYNFFDLRNVVCPLSYRSPLGKARNKARVLDYFRSIMNFTEHDWILHMDEESETDAESLRRMFDFIRYTPHCLGQGIILYNAAHYFQGNNLRERCASWFFSLADFLRVGDDLARFHLQFSYFHRPVFGVHGSFLLVNGKVENDITWDCSSLAEDYEFSHLAWKQGYTCGRIHGIVREQSPTSFADFLKQRRRWFCGIRKIKGQFGLPKIAINLWVIGVFQMTITLLNFPLSILFDDGPSPFWIALSAAFCFSTFLNLYFIGWLFSELDAGTSWPIILLHAPCMILQPFASLAEGLAAIWALSSESLDTFEVIQKT